VIEPRKLAELISQRAVKKEKGESFGGSNVMRRKDWKGRVIDVEAEIGRVCE
jgi:hypothetical protein